MHQVLKLCQLQDPMETISGHFSIRIRIYACAFIQPTLGRILY